MFQGLIVGFARLGRPSFSGSLFSLSNCFALFKRYFTVVRSRSLNTIHEVFNGLRWIVRTGAQWREMASTSLLIYATSRLATSHLAKILFCLRPFAPRRK
jgi:hypothetical protein